MTSRDQQEWNEWRQAQWDRDEREGWALKNYIEGKQARGVKPTPETK